MKAVLAVHIPYPKGHEINEKVAWLFFMGVRYFLFCSVHVVVVFGQSTTPSGGILGS